jgi:Ner family transcriptional regulator
MSTAAKQTKTDWHPWDIKAALGKKGYTFSRIAKENGYYPTTPCDVLRRQWPDMERILANIIGVEAWEIWPTRYDDRNEPIRHYLPAKAA